MANVEKIINIENKRKMYKVWFILNKLVAIGLTLVGTVSILSLLMYLYEVYNISFLECLTLDFILPSVYSLIVNPLINSIDRKLENTLIEIDILEEEYRKELEYSKRDIFIHSIDFRFQNLSIENQMKLLNYVKDDCLLQGNYNDMIEQLNVDEKKKFKEEFDDTQILIQNNGYSRRRIKNAIENNV